MAKNKLREIISERGVWLLAFLGVMILYILGLMGTVIFVHDIAIKVVMIIFEVPTILFGILIFVLSIKKN